MLGLGLSRLGRLGFAVVAGACTTVNISTGGSDDDCEIGEERCACTQGGGCNDTLVCLSGVCVDAGGGGGAAGAEGDGGSSSGARSGGAASGGHGETSGGGGGASGAPADGGDAGATSGGGWGGPTEPAECLATSDGEPIPGDFYQEPAAGDWPDCVSSCPTRYVLQPFDVVLPDVDDGVQVEVGGARFDGLRGVLDADEHSPYASDRDLIRVVVAAGTAVEITVDPAGPDSCIDPHVSTLDPQLADPASGLMTINDDRAAGDRAARTTLAAPADASREWFVLIEDARSFSGAFLVGGSTYDYVVRFQTFGLQASEGLVLTDGVADVSGARLELAGDAHYYTFADPSHQTHLIRFTTTNPDFCAHMWQLDPEGGFRWVSSGVTAEAPCPSVVEWTTNPLFFGASTDSYGFLVTDASGRGDNSGFGDFGYDLHVTRVN